jgi:hypothetical protein
VPGTRSGSLIGLGSGAFPSPSGEGGSSRSEGAGWGVPESDVFPPGRALRDRPPLRGGRTTVPLPSNRRRVPWIPARPYPLSSGAFPSPSGEGGSSRSEGAGWGVPEADVSPPGRALRDRPPLRGGRTTVPLPSNRRRASWLLARPCPRSACPRRRRGGSAPLRVASSRAWHWPRHRRRPCGNSRRAG